MEMSQKSKLLFVHYLKGLISSQ